jgi:hypothetical protein
MLPMKCMTEQFCSVRERWHELDQTLSPKVGPGQAGP